MRWIQKYIHSFGGDPTKVTMYTFHFSSLLYFISHTSRRWGESAGAISVALHMVANGGNAEGLFRAAFMESGSALPTGDITDGQPHYDALVQQTGCANSNDTLQCLRELPFDTFLAAMNMSPGIFDFQVRQLDFCDGHFL